MLDVGCGSGTLLGVLQNRGFDVIGFDSSAEAAAIARDQNGVHVIAGASLDEGKFNNSSFDIVSLFHVMEHVCEPRRLLGDVRRLLNRAGRVVVQVPNIDSWQSKLCGVRWYGLDAPRHVINYSYTSIGRLLTDTGFRVRRVRHFNLRDNAPALASSLFPSLDPLTRNVRQRMRNRRERAPVTWFKHAAYLGVIATVYPFAIAEALNGCGATLMIDAEKI
jgi:SAM-dependent methyltransferase